MTRGSKMTLKIKLTIYVAIASAISVLFWYQTYQLDKLQENVQILSANSAKLETAVKLQEQTVTALETGLGNAIESSNDLARKITLADEQRQVITQELNSYRGRLGNAALKKPTLIERRATAATTNILHQFAEATGSKD